MNLLFLSQVFPDDRAPVRGTFNRALCAALAKQHQVRVLAPRPWLETVPRRLRGQGPSQAGETLAGTGVVARYPTYWYLPRVLQHRYGLAMYRSLRRDLHRLTADFRPDAVLSYWAHPEGRAGLEVARELGIPAACIIGGTDVLQLPHRHPLRYREVVRVLRESDAILTVSDGLRQACLELGAPPASVQTVYQGIDPHLFQPRDGDEARRRLGIPPGVPAYVWVGRMVEVKRLELLLEAVARLHRSGRRLKVYLLGDGPLAGPWRALARQLSVEAVVDFVGPVGQQHLADWYSAADATVLCSQSEGLPNVLRETLACGTPFVSTDVGSIREIADPACSILVPPDDPASLADAMQAVLQDSYRQGARQHRPRTWSDTARDVATLLAALSDRRSTAAPCGVAAATAVPLAVVQCDAEIRSVPTATATGQPDSQPDAAFSPIPPVSGDPIDYTAVLNRRLQPVASVRQHPEVPA